MATFLYLLFALSGAAGLVYEATWQRYLGLLVGHDADAQVFVLVLFLGGMSIGAFAAGKRSERVARPLAAYAVVEALIGLAGLSFHAAFQATMRLAFDRLFPAIHGAAGVAAAKWALAALLVLPPSILLGATFPLMSAGALRLLDPRGEGTSGRILSMLYFSNSLGASAGVLVSGFFLIGLAGLPGTLAAAASANLAVALLVLLLAGPLERPGNRPAAPADAAPSSELPLPRLGRVLLAAAFLTAVASFVYEIAWIRMLSLVLGAATHSFELMLSAFILGLAAGSFWIRRRSDRFADPLRALGVIQWAMGCLAVATLPLYLASFRWTATLLSALDRTEAGYRFFTVSRYGFCLAVMLPATFCAGMTLPLITRTLLRGGAGERAIGAVYGANTLGSILGAALAGLVLLPLLGLKPLLVAGAAIDAGVGVVLLVLAARAGGHPPRLARFAAASFALLALVVSFAARFDPSVLSSGVYRYGGLPAPGSREIVSHRDGRTATVSVTRNVADGTLVLATNGKPDASVTRAWTRPPHGEQRPPLRGDEPTQATMPVLCLAHRPGAKTAAVIGLGSGISSHVFLGDPGLTRVTTIEIEKEMVRGAALFRPANRRVFEDPRSELVLDDAKSFFAGAGRRFDIVLSEPSNPWVSGVSGLFTVEFYERVRRYLAPGGVFGQWLHLYELSDPLVLSVLAAIDRNFPAWDAWLVSGADLLIIASDRELPPPDWSVASRPGIAEDLSRFAPIPPRPSRPCGSGGAASSPLSPPAPCPTATTSPSSTSEPSGSASSGGRRPASSPSARRGSTSPRPSRGDDLPPAPSGCRRSRRSRPSGLSPFPRASRPPSTGASPRSPATAISWPPSGGRGASRRLPGPASPPPTGSAGASSSPTWRGTFAPAPPARRGPASSGRPGATPRRTGRRRRPSPPSTCSRLSPPPTGNGPPEASAPSPPRRFAATTGFRSSPPATAA